VHEQYGGAEQQADFEAADRLAAYETRDINDARLHRGCNV